MQRQVPVSNLSIFDKFVIDSELDFLSIFCCLVLSSRPNHWHIIMLKFSLKRQETILISDTFYKSFIAYHHTLEQKYLLRILIEDLRSSQISNLVLHT